MFDNMDLDFLLDHIPSSPRWSSILSSDLEKLFHLMTNFGRFAWVLRTWGISPCHSCMAVHITLSRPRLQYSEPDNRFIKFMAECLTA